MGRRHLVVAVGQHQERGQVGEPAADVAEHVQRGVVRPVQVFDDEHRRPPRGELGNGGGGHRIGLPVAAAGERCGQRPGGAGRRLAQGPECARAQQVVAGPGEHAHTVVERRPQGADHAGLPDPGLAGEDRGAAVAGGGRRDRAEQDVHHRFPFEQRGPSTARVPGRTRKPVGHASILAPAAVTRKASAAASTHRHG